MANPRARFVLVPATSVKLQVEGACGYEVSDEIAALLSEDVSYRLREVTQVARICHTCICYAHIDDCATIWRSRRRSPIDIALRKFQDCAANKLTILSHHR